MLQKMAKEKEKNVIDYTLEQSSEEFVNHLPEAEREPNRKELNNFLRWYGRGKKIKDISAQALEDYSVFLSGSRSKATESLKPVKAFFTYARKKGWTPPNLSASLKVPKTKAASSAASKALPEELILTQDGYQQMKEELKGLKKLSPELAEEIRKAAADKDVRENAPLEAARERQGKVESKIRELEEVLASARIAPTEKEKLCKIDIGSRITICEVNSKEAVCYLLVEPAEANPIIGKISISSPVGKALRGKWIGERVDVAAPGGLVRYSIEAVE